MTKKFLSASALALLLSLAACGKNTSTEAPVNSEAPEETVEETTETQAEVTPPPTESEDPGAVNRPDYAEVVASDSRPETDRELDELRRPAEVLEFMGLKRGWTVLELEAGNGYYTELMSTAVGPNGVVYMQNPAEFDAFLGDAVTNRLADDRLPNVRYLKSDFDEVPLAEETAHVITWILGPHELWFYPENKPDGFGDPATTFASLKGIMRPNGRLIILDHAAAPGSPETTGGETHRIDPDFIIALAEAAGLEVDKRSDILANPEDEYDKNVFDPAVRRKTDRFLISFKKAGATVESE